MAKQKKTAKVTGIDYVENPDIAYITRRLSKIMNNTKLPITVRAAAKKALGADDDLQITKVEDELGKINTDFQLPLPVRVEASKEIQKIWAAK